MTEARLVALQHALGWLAALCCLCAAAALLDGLTVPSDQARPLALLPGETVPLTGPLPASIADTTALTVRSTSPDVRLSVTERFSGYWLGAPMWRGELRAEAQAQPGTVGISLLPPNEPPQVRVVQVFPNASARNAASPSVTRRLLGWPPFLVAGLFLAGGVGLGIVVYRLGRRLDTLWRAQGKAVITKTAASPEGLHIFFSLGGRQGLTCGEPVHVCDAAGRIVASGLIVRCTHDAAEALLAAGEPVRAGLMAHCASSAPAQAVSSGQ